MKFYLLLIPVCFLMWACNMPAESPYPALQVDRIDSSKIQGRASAVSFIIGNKAYVAMGRTTGGVFLSSCVEFDPTTNQWKNKTDFPGYKRVKAIAVALDGRAYMGLGFENNTAVYEGKGYLKDWYCYLPDSDKWIPKSPFPGEQSDATCAFAYNGCVYIVTGFTEKGFSAECWKYDPQTDSWTKLNDFKGVSRTNAVVCANDTRIFLGTGYNTNNLNDWWEYYPAQDNWKQKKSLPDNGRFNAVAFSVNQRLYVATGRRFGGTYTGGHLYDDILEYDILRNVWYLRGTLPTARENAVAFSVNGKGYIGFGEDENGTILNDFYCITP